MGQLARVLGAVWRRARRPGPTFRGVYPSFEAVPRRGPGYGGRLWLEGTRRLIKSARPHLASGCLDEVLPGWGEHALLPIVAGTLAPGPVRILDFGGGMGIGFVATRAALPRGVALEYVIVETAESVASGRALWADERSIRFTEDIPVDGSFDIVYSRSALQYVPDWESTLRALLRSHARFALFVLLTAGEIPTYAAQQLNVPGSSIPIWFLRQSDFLSVAASEGYTPATVIPSDQRAGRNAIRADYALRRARTILLRHE